MGITLFVVLSMMLRVPVYENYYLCLGYIAMAVYLYSFRTVQGTIVGAFGTILYCLLINGLRGMPGWSLGNIAIGIAIGIPLGITFDFLKKHDIHNNTLAFYVFSACAVMAGTGLGVLIIKSLTECLLYAQPFAVRTASNIYAYVTDVFVLCLSLPFCKYIDKYIKKFV